MVAINNRAEQNAITNVVENAGSATKGVRFKMIPLDEKLNGYRTYDYSAVQDESGKKSYVRSGRIVEMDTMDNYSKFEATVSSTLPRAYYLPASMKPIADHLKKQGIKVEQLSKSKRASGEVFVVSALEKATRKFEGHFMATAKGEFVKKSRSFKKR